MHQALYLAVGLAAGVMSGLFGVGGGIIIVPALVFLTGASQTAAAGTSLVALLLPVGLGGVLAYYRAGEINTSHIRMGLLIAAGLFAGGFGGAKLALVLGDKTLKQLFALLLFVLAIKTWMSAR